MTDQMPLTTVLPGLPYVDAPSTPDDVVRHRVHHGHPQGGHGPCQPRGLPAVRRHRQARRPLSHRVVAVDQRWHRGQQQRARTTCSTATAVVAPLAVRHQPRAWSRRRVPWTCWAPTAHLGVPSDGRDLGSPGPRQATSLLLRGSSEPFNTSLTHPRLLEARLTLARSSRGDRTAAPGDPAARQVGLA